MLKKQQLLSYYYRETIIQQSLKHKVMSSVSVFSVPLRKWETLGTDFLDTLNKYHFVFSEVPSTHCQPL